MRLIILTSHGLGASAPEVAGAHGFTGWGAVTPQGLTGRGWTAQGFTACGAELTAQGLAGRDAPQGFTAVWAWAGGLSVP